MPVFDKLRRLRKLHKVAPFPHIHTFGRATDGTSGKIPP
jgi:hypothetical protein